MSKVKLIGSCNHNARRRYDNGFFCEDCNAFFPKDSPTYRSSELLSSITFVLHNINVYRYRSGLSEDKEVKELEKIIGYGEQHENYEELISKAEVLMKKYNKNSDSASIVLNG